MIQAYCEQSDLTLGNSAETSTSGHVADEDVVDSVRSEMIDMVRRRVYHMPGPFEAHINVVVLLQSFSVHLAKRV